MKPFLDLSSSSAVVAKRASFILGNRVRPAEVRGWVVSILSMPDLEKIVGGLIVHPSHLGDDEIAPFLKRFKIVVVKVVREQRPHRSGGTVNYLPRYLEEEVGSWKAAGAHGVAIRSDMWPHRSEDLRISAFEQASVARICQKYEMVHMPLLGVVREDVDTIEVHLDNSLFLLQELVATLPCLNWAMTIPMVEPILPFSGIDRGWGVEKLVEVNRDLISVFPNAAGLALVHRSKELSIEVIGALQTQVKKPQLIGVFVFQFSTAFEYWCRRYNDLGGVHLKVREALEAFSP